MKQASLKLGVKKLPRGKIVRFVMELTPEQSKAIRILAIQKGSTVKGMVLDLCNIPRDI